MNISLYFLYWVLIYDFMIFLVSYILIIFDKFFVFVNFNIILSCEKKDKNIEIIFYILMRKILILLW